MITHKVRTRCQLIVPLFGQREKTYILEPLVVEAKWTRNGAVEADELTLTLDWSDAGFDPRTIENGTVAFWLWDAALEDFDLGKHLRFTGIVTAAEREQNAEDSRVEIRCKDYTILFIEQKHLPPEGMPVWSDTLRQAWERICDNTGYWSRDDGKINSSVSDLRGSLVIRNPEDESKIAGLTVPKRFHAISRPQFGGPKASSWKVWTSFVAALGLHTFIDRDECIVVRPSDLYAPDAAPVFLYGENVIGIKETVDTAKTTKGILLKSFNPIEGHPLEAFYPPPGDPRLKTKRSAASKRSEGGAAITANEVSEDYDAFDYSWIIDQTTLDARAREAYEERSRQELKGTLRTAETECQDPEGRVTSIFDLAAGDPIQVLWDHLDENLDGTGSQILKMSRENRARHYIELGYAEETAFFLAENIEHTQQLGTIRHVETISVDLGPEHFEVEISYHNRIELG